jgi:hypothetical protein
MCFQNSLKKGQIEKKNSSEINLRSFLQGQLKNTVKIEKH